MRIKLKLITQKVCEIRKRKPLNINKHIYYECSLCGYKSEISKEYIARAEVVMYCPICFEHTLHIKREVEVMKVSSDLIASEFLTAEDIKQAVRAKIVDEGELSQGQFGDRITVKVLIGKTEKRLTLNKTSTRNLVEKFGEETKGWKGKTITIKKVQMIIRGKEMDVLLASG